MVSYYGVGSMTVTMSLLCLFREVSRVSREDHRQKCVWTKGEQVTGTRDGEKDFRTISDYTRGKILK